MSDAVMDVGFVLADAFRYADKDIGVRGVVFVRDDKALLFSSDADKGPFLEIVDKNFIDRLLDNVPCYVGGEFLYRDRVTIIGHLHVGESEVTLGEVSGGRLERGGEVFEF